MITKACSLSENIVICFSLWLCFAVWPAIAFDSFWQVGAGNWNTGSNWTQGAAPTADPFEEVGVINNGGIATLNSAAPDAAGLRLGDAAGESGTLQVLSGGSINFVESTGAPDGTANIGLDGTGVLEVQSGGSVSTTSLDVNVGSSVILGGGAGSASLVSTGGMFFNGTTIVKGAGHTFSAAGAVNLEGEGVFAPQISSASHTTLSTSGVVNLDGQLEVQFDNGFSPSLGDTWNLFDAGSVSGEFDTVVAPAVGTGEVYRVKTIDGGANGRLVQLEFAAALRLLVNGNTGNVSISSPSGTAIDIAGYSILSGSGQLSVASWNSLEDQPVPLWHEAAPDKTALNELYQDGSNGFSINATEVSLGAAYATPTQFGQSPDIAFEYVTEENEVVQGLVEYTGNLAANNLVVVVDPASGEAQLVNSSAFSISLIGYSVLSDSGSLQPGNSDWSSLDDQSVGTWVESAPTANALSELVAGEGSMLSPGQTFALGNLFDEVGGTQDLTLEFLLDGEAAPRDGIVLYGNLAVGLPGDFNGDQVVNGADFLLWQRGGSPNPLSPTDLIEWETNYGSSGLASITAVSFVPEPAGLLLGFMCCVTICVLHRCVITPSKC